ncbi:MAG: hypothetical protein ACM31G_09735 [Flavobacteriales bacterium]
MKTVYDKQDITIAIGANSFSIPKNFKYKGKCVGVKLVDFSSAQARAHAININVSDSSNTLIGSTDYRDFIQLGGGYKEGFKPCDFDTKTEVTIDAIATANVATTAFDAQLIFMIEEDCN